MNWKLKAAVQRGCAALPVGSEAAYYLLQRAFGRVRDPARPVMMMQAARLLLRALREQGFDPDGKRVMEVGTGWRVDVPIAFYLCGARSVATYDLHRYLKPALVMSTLAVLARHRELVFEVFQTLTDPAALQRRIDALVRVAAVDDLFRLARIEYHAPADAARTAEASESVDLHVSFNVLQHIPYATLLRILGECNRVLSPAGLACHHIDLSDHFAHTDPAINRVNFLRFSDDEWARRAGNQFGYHNRLRVTDYERLYREVGHEIRSWATEVDERAERELAQGFPVAAQFSGLPARLLAIDTLRVISQPVRRPASAHASAAPEGRPAAKR